MRSRVIIGKIWSSIMILGEIAFENYELKQNYAEKLRCQYSISDCSVIDNRLFEKGFIENVEFRQWRSKLRNRAMRIFFACVHFLFYLLLSYYVMGLVVLLIVASFASVDEQVVGVQRLYRSWASSLRSWNIS